MYFIKVELTVLLHVNTIASGMAQRYSKGGRKLTWVSLYNCMLIIIIMLASMYAYIHIPIITMTMTCYYDT